MTYYLSADTGNDSNDGSIGSPWLTIAKAHTEASDGDEIICLNSTNTYEWDFLDFTKELAIRGERVDGLGARFDADAGTNTIWSHFKNLHLENITLQNNFNAISWGGAILRTQADDISLSLLRVRFRDLYIGGRNGFQNNGIFTVQSNRNNISVSVRACTIEDSVQSSNASLGMGGMLWNYRNCPNTNLVIQDNTIAVAEYTGETAIQRIVEVGNASSSTLDMRNNIIYSAEPNAIAMVNGSTSLETAVFDNNCYYTTGAAFSNVPSGTGNITEDPLFVDLDNKNFELRPASPVIGQGVNI